MCCPADLDSMFVLGVTFGGIAREGNTSLAKKNRCVRGIAKRKTHCFNYEGDVIVYNMM